MTKKRLLKYVVGIISIMVLTIIGWEQVDEGLADWYEGEAVTYTRQEQSPTTVDGIVEERAYSWLKSPEALEYAKKQVTSTLIDELSKQ